MPLGLYISVPFCRTKCTYCNFASDVFSRVVFESYVNRVCYDLQRARTIASETGGRFEGISDSVYLGGGTPTVLDLHKLQRLFVTIRQNFCLDPEAEITSECAPGTLSAGMIATLAQAGVNRVSLGVQSFVDVEAASVGRLHQRETVLKEIARLRTAGISNINIDLIAGLPHQTVQSWEFSLNEVIGSGVPHVSVYMLEIDEDSRLGRELIAGGTRYHAHFVPDEDLTADLYLLACDRLNRTGIKQYEISNFACPGYESRHNLKYWTRQPYMGFGVDAHSMLQGSGDVESVRLATTDALEKYVAGTEWKRTFVSRQEALEETFFLGLRLNRGVDLDSVERQFGGVAVAGYTPAIDELANNGLLERNNGHISLTSRGRLLSNEVFEKFVFEGAL
jgi:putative oxygen-independent coproporphyrinogen III oxidase